MATQAEKAHLFRELHTQKKPFIIPNPWDSGSARVLAGLGFRALATTSSGFATSIGMVDGEPGREAVLAHAATLVSATDLPVSADLENAFGDSPEAVADTFRGALAAGLVGGSVEDYSGKALYDIEHAADRVRAAVEAVRGAGFPFLVTGRAENFFRGKPDLADTIRRLQAYQEAGADVLFAPALPSREALETVLREVDRPLNVLGGVGGLAALTMADYESLGVRRISVGSLLASLAYGSLIHAARELKDAGSFSWTQELARARDLRALIRGRAD
jgi:2-methylisocitrate lyase-like PEP mutase family enzyme